LHIFIARIYIIQDIAKKNTVDATFSKSFMTFVMIDFFTLQVIYSFIHSGYLYSASSSLLLLRGAPDYRTDVYCIGVSRRSATGNYEWRTCRKAPNLPMRHHTTQFEVK